jgi:tetratricopeptide (TPR) repeat protein
LVLKQKLLHQLDQNSKEKKQVEKQYVVLKISKASTLRCLKKFDESVQLYKDVIEEVNNLFGEQNVFLATCFNNVGLSLKQSGNMSEAEGFYLKSLDLR